MHASYHVPRTWVRTEAAKLRGTEEFAAENRSVKQSQLELRRQRLFFKHKPVADPWLCGDIGGFACGRLDLLS
jgi:hypothetical protein